MKDGSGWGKDGEFLSPLDHIHMVPPERRKQWFYTDVLSQLNLEELQGLLDDAAIASQKFGIDQNTLEILLEERQDKLRLRLQAQKSRGGSQSFSVNTPNTQWDALPDRTGKRARHIPGPDSMGITQNEDEDWN